MSSPARASGAPGILTLAIKDRDTLYQSYMPFLKGGGVFVPTEKAYQLGDDVFILLTLPDSTERVPVAGTVSWVTPRGAQGKRLQGIGVQFSTQDNGATQRKIETLLAASLSSDKPTHTM